MILGQVKKEDKSDEITAIPTLLDLLELEGAIVAIDAMDCRREIAEKIVEKGADYILAVKDNQKFLHDDIKDAFAQTPKAISHTITEKGHGRIEKGPQKNNHYAVDGRVEVIIFEMDENKRSFTKKFLLAERVWGVFGESFGNR